MNSLTEDPVRGAEQLDQFVEPNFLSGMAMMFLMGMLFTGEEGGAIRWAAVQEWERSTEERSGPVGRWREEGSQGYRVRPQLEQSAGEQSFKCNKPGHTKKKLP